MINDYDELDGFIYIRDTDYYKKNNVYKVGITKDLHSRNSTYKTGELVEGEFILVFKVQLEQLHYVDMELKKKLEPFHVKLSGGSEFYLRDVIDHIETFLKSLNVKYTVLTKEEIFQKTKKSNKHKHKKHKKEEKQNEKKIGCLSYIYRKIRKLFICF